MKKFYFIFLCLAMWLSASAYDFEMDGIYYNIIGTGQVEVTRGDSYSGNVTIPSTVSYNSVAYSVISIGEKAFEYCSGLTSVTIPNSVISIEFAAFGACSGLTSVTLPNSVTYIGYHAFEFCSGLTSISVDAGNMYYDSRNNCNAIIETSTNTLIQGCQTTVIPNSVTSIGDFSFYYCSGMTSVTIPNSVTSIGKSAFGSCDGLTSVTIGNSVTSIGDHAFEGCIGLTSVTIPNSVTSIGDAAFHDCDGLTSISVDAGNTHYDSRNNCNAIIETSTNTLIQGCQTTVIPNSVTSIGDAAFDECDGLTSVTIPNSVTSIGDAAFGFCWGLTSVTIPNSVTSIGGGAFYRCSGLTSISVDAGNTHYDSRNNCNAIIETSTNTLIQGCQTTVIPNNVISIGDNAFYGCSGLTSVTIPNSVTAIGNYAFHECSGLTSVTIPDSVTSIGDAAFGVCWGLTSVTIGSSVTSIGNNAFAGYVNITDITVNITDITCKAVTPPTIASSTFDNYNATLYVPSGSVNAYSSALYWKNFNIQPISDGTSHTVTVNSNDEQMGTTMGGGTYEENSTAQLIAVTQAGYSFQKWSDGNTDNPRDVVVTGDSAFTAEFAVATGANDTIYLEYDGRDAMQYSLEDNGVYYFGGKVYNSQNLYIKLYYSDGKLLSSGTNDIDMSYYADGIYIVTDGKGGFLKINHSR